MTRELPFTVNLWKPQNVYFDISQTIRPEWSKPSGQRHNAAKPWDLLFAELGEALGFSMPALSQVEAGAATDVGKPAEPALAAAT
jgi:hypothetical protein